MPFWPDKVQAGEVLGAIVKYFDEVQNQTVRFTYEMDVISDYQCFEIQ